MSSHYRNRIRNWLARSRILAAMFSLNRNVSPGHLRFGDLRRLSPLSKDFGYDRGTPIDRHYIEVFLSTYRHDIAGRVLEVGDDAYTREFAGGDILSSEVLHVSADSPNATYVGDLINPDTLPHSRFDCAIITQTLHLIFDLQLALQHIHDALTPGGVALVTFPGISQISNDHWADNWCWSLTPVSAAILFGRVFGAHNVQVESHGNVLTSISFLQGIAAEELSAPELSASDPRYPMLICVRAIRQGDSGTTVRPA